MSAPVHRDDETDDFRFYAPPWVRERSPSSTFDAPAVDSPAAAAGSGDTDLAKSSKPPDATNLLSRPADQAEAEIPPGREEWPPASARPQTASSPRMAPGVGGPNLHSPPTPPAPHRVVGVQPSLKFAPIRSSDELSPTSGRRPFEGDVAIKALQQRMSLDPEFVPAPPRRGQRKAGRPWLNRRSFGVGIAAVAAFVVVFVTQPAPREPVAKGDKGISPVVAPQPGGPRLAAAVSTPVQPLVRLVAEDREAFTNEALPLGISLNGGMGGEMVVLSGLATGTRISVGSSFGASGWRVPARDLAQALAYAPQDFAGVMEPTIDLRAGNDVLVESRSIRLAWLPRQSEAASPEPRVDQHEPVQPAAILSIDAEELATLMRRGQDLLKTGDIAAARLFLRRAANAGNQQAALTLGATFDPVVLEELGVLGFPPDPAQARSWYDKAARLGSAEALRRIERLARAGD